MWSTPRARARALTDCAGCSVSSETSTEGLSQPRTEIRAGKIRERIERIKAKSRGIAQHYHIDIDTDPKGHQRITATFARANVRTLHVRKATRAEPPQQAIYDALGVDPEPGGIRKTIV